MARDLGITIRCDATVTEIEGKHYAVRLDPYSEWQTDGDPSVIVGVQALSHAGADRNIIHL